MSNSNSSSSASGGIGVSGLLGVAFVVLKLMGIITWSWWWVTAPFWGPVVLLLVVCLVAVAVWAVAEVSRSSRARRR